MKTTTMRGKIIDIAAMREQHGTMRAIGNANMNARGDRLDRDGKIIQTREEIAQAYNENNPNAVTSSPISLRDISDEAVMTPAQALASLGEKPKRKSRDVES